MLIVCQAGSVIGASTYVVITIVIVDYIFAIRVLAFWTQFRKLEVFLKCLIAAEGLLRIVIIIKEEVERNSKTFASDIIPGMTICVEAASQFRQSWIVTLVDWVFVFCVGLTLTALVIYKAAEFWRLSAGFRGFHLVRVIVRDQGVYYFLVVCCGILSIINHTLPLTKPLAQATLGGMGNASIILLSLLGSRLVFNLKEAAEIGVNEGTNYRHNATTSEMNFT
ncbi:hypothetical protein PNOK_0836800 [Pyrrhoderma noxium]|uniref:Transmembrane protein n=1 Tax=Pyrrhoderma noxium TaxID=2282107 RepID=A0A286UB00_9AGAM|nr:hypothetical protein PNOK_0836800 [Pyrrhoderma noxium]